VAGASIIGSVALYEVLNRALGEPEDVGEGDEGGNVYEWDARWATALDAHAVGNSDGARMLAAGEALRTTSRSRVGRRHLIFVRHAQPNEESAAEGSRASASAALSSTGQRQADLTGQRLLGLFEDSEVSVIYHAPSPEARATAKILRRNLPKAALIESPLLEEGFPIVPSPSPAGLDPIPEDELMRDMARAEGAFRTHVWPPSGEEKDSSTVEVVVGHGNLIRYLVCRALQLDPASWSRLAAFHGAITWLDIDSEGRVGTGDNDEIAPEDDRDQPSEELS